MTAQAQLLLPPQPLANCIAAGIFRDTLDANLPDEDRLNYFPATPLFSVTRVLQGQLHMATELTDMASLRASPAMQTLTATPPQDSPICSWSPAGMRAVTISLYPDAWTAMGGTPDGSTLPKAIADALMTPFDDPKQYWGALCTALTSTWEAARNSSPAHPNWPGSTRVSDWARHVTTAAALSGTGRSLRSMERRLRRWTGHSKQAIDFYAKIEDLYAHSLKEADTPLAQIAADADFSDQSHMGRAVKRATGFSPAQINHLIATAEPFWCYRLLGERF